MKTFFIIISGILLTFVLFSFTGCLSLIEDLTGDDDDLTSDDDIQGSWQPSPSDMSSNQSQDVDLSWSCTHLNGTSMTYDVYFGTSDNPSRISQNQIGKSYDPGSLMSNTDYYWKIFVITVDNGVSRGEIWKFTTGSDGGNGGGNGGGTRTHTIVVDLSIEVLTNDDHLADRSWQQGIHWVIESYPNQATRNGDLTAWDGGSDETTISWSRIFNVDDNAQNKFTLYTSGSPSGTVSTQFGPVPKCGNVRYSMTVTVDGDVRHNDTDMLNTQQTSVLTLSLRQ